MLMFIISGIIFIVFAVITLLIYSGVDTHKWLSLIFLISYLKLLVSRREAERLIL